MALYPSYNNGTVIRVDLTNINTTTAKKKAIYISLVDGSIVNQLVTPIFDDYRLIERDFICCGFVEPCGGWRTMDITTCWTTENGTQWLPM